MADTGLIDTEPREDYTLSEYSHALAVQGPGDPTKPVPTPTPHPVQTFWDKLLHGVDGKSRTAEMLKGVGRGVVNAGSELMNTVSESASALPNVDITGTGITTGMVGDATGAVSKGETALETHFLGQRSDDPLAAFTESATQFMAGWEATGELKALKGVAGGLARGVIVDGTMFNPYEAQLAELWAKAPPILGKAVGQFLSVKGDDGVAVARLKRAAAGVIPAATIEGLVAASRLVRSGKALAAGTGDAADVAKAAKTVQNVADGTHVADNAHVAVDPQTNTLVKPDGTPLPDSPTFESPVEARQQVESMNAALTARATAGQVNPAALAETTDALKATLSDPTPANVAASTDASLDLSHQTTPDDALAITQRLSKQFAQHVRHAVEAQGEVHVAQSMQAALNGLAVSPNS